MKRFDFWRKWLFWVSILVAVFGLVMALFSNTPLFTRVNNQVDPVFWGASVTNTTALMFRSWIYGVLGATVLGWGITLTFIARYPFKNKEKWSWWAIACGTAAWYILDTSFSVYFGVYFNAAFNTVMLLLITLPLILTFNEFKTKT